MARIRCKDGIIREFIPSDSKFSSLSTGGDFRSLHQNEKIGKYIRRGLYCNHCREELGFVEIRSETVLNHCCNKLYNNENNLKRLRKF